MMRRTFTGRRRLLLENLEPRILLAAWSNLAVNDAVITDSAGVDPDDVNVTIIGANTNTTVDITFTDAGAGVEDTITAINIDDPTPGGVDNLIVEIATTGGFGPAVVVNYNGSAGDTLDLRLYTEGIDDTAAGGYGDILTGATSGFTAGSGAGGTVNNDAAGAVADGHNLTAAAGDFLGGVTVDADTTVVAGNIINTVGSIGAITFQGAVGLTGALTVTPNSTGAAVDATVTSFTIDGDTTLGAFNLTVTTADATATAASGVSSTTGVSISSGGTVLLDGAGNLLIQTANAGEQGPVTLGTLSLGTGGAGGAVTVQSDGGNADITGDVIVDAIGIVAAAGGTAAVTIDPSGTGNFGGSITIGDVTLAGTGAGNDVNIGGATAALTGSFAVGNVTNSSTADADLDVDFNTVGGNLTVNGNVILQNAGSVNAGDFTIDTAGNVTGNLQVTGAVAVGDAGDADTADFTVTSGGSLGTVGLDGNLTLAGSSTGMVQVVANTNMGDLTFGGAAGITHLGTGGQQILFQATTGNMGSVDLTGKDIVMLDGGGTTQNGSLVFSGGTAVGTFTVRDILLGDVGLADNDAPWLQVTSPNGGIGAVQMRNVTMDDGVRGVGFAVQFDADLTGTSNNGVGTVTIETIQTGDVGSAAFQILSDGAVGNLTLGSATGGTIQSGSGAEAAASGLVRIAADWGAPDGTGNLGNIALQNGVLIGDGDGDGDIFFSGAAIGNISGGGTLGSGGDASADITENTVTLTASAGAIGTTTLASHIGLTSNVTYNSTDGIGAVNVESIAAGANVAFNADTDADADGPMGTVTTSEHIGSNTTGMSIAAFGVGMIDVNGVGGIRGGTIDYNNNAGATAAASFGTGGVAIDSAAAIGTDGGGTINRVNIILTDQGTDTSVVGTITGVGDVYLNNLQSAGNVAAVSNSGATGSDIDIATLTMADNGAAGFFNSQDTNTLARIVNTDTAAGADITIGAFAGLIGDWAGAQTGTGAIALPGLTVSGFLTDTIVSGLGVGDDINLGGTLTIIGGLAADAAANTITTGLPSGAVNTAYVINAGQANVIGTVDMNARAASVVLTVTDQDTIYTVDLASGVTARVTTVLGVLSTATRLRNIRGTGPTSDILLASSDAGLDGNLTDDEGNPHNLDELTFFAGEGNADEVRVEGQFTGVAPLTFDDGLAADGIGDVNTLFFEQGFGGLVTAGDIRVESLQGIGGLAITPAALAGADGIIAEFGQQYGLPGLPIPPMLDDVIYHVDDFLPTELGPFTLTANAGQTTMFLFSTSGNPLTEFIAITGGADATNVLVEGIDGDASGNMGVFLDANATGLVPGNAVVGIITPDKNTAGIEVTTGVRAIQTQAGDGTGAPMANNGFIEVEGNLGDVVLLDPATISAGFDTGQVGVDDAVLIQNDTATNIDTGGVGTLASSFAPVSAGAGGALNGDAGSGANDSFTTIVDGLFLQAGGAGASLAGGLSLIGGGSVNIASVTVGTLTGSTRGGTTIAASGSLGPVAVTGANQGAVGSDMTTASDGNLTGATGALIATGDDFIGGLTAPGDVSGHIIVGARKISGSGSDALFGNDAADDVFEAAALFPVAGLLLSTVVLEDVGFSSGLIAQTSAGTTSTVFQTTDDDLNDNPADGLDGGDLGDSAVVAAGPILADFISIDDFNYDLVSITDRIGMTDGSSFVRAVDNVGATQAVDVLAGTDVLIDVLAGATSDVFADASFDGTGTMVLGIVGAGNDVGVATDAAPNYLAASDSIAIGSVVALGGDVNVNIDAGANTTAAQSVAGNTLAITGVLSADNSVGDVDLGEGGRYYRADGNVTIATIDAGLNDVDANTTENVLVNVFAGLESDGDTVATLPTGLPIISNLIVTNLLSDDNVGLGGQLATNGFMATGNATLTTVTVGGISRNAAAGFQESNDPFTNDFDDGGSFLINVIAGWRGQVSTDALTQAMDANGDLILGTMLVDDDVGGAPTTTPAATAPYLPTYPANAGNVLAAAADVAVTNVSAGRSFTTFTGASYGATSSVNTANSVGDFNIDVVAGVDQSTFDPIRANINDVSTALPGGAYPQLAGGVNAGLYQDTITVTALTVGINAVNNPLTAAPDVAPFIPDAIGTPILREGDGNFNATFLAGAGVTADVEIRGNLLGRDGVGGRALVAAAAYLGSNFAAPSDLTLTGRVHGDFVGSLNSGAFVPFDNSGNNPFNPNDLGPLQAGTVLTLGRLNVGTAADSLFVGRIIGSVNGVAGDDGITLAEALTGGESLADRIFLGTTTFSSTHDTNVNLYVWGRPFATGADPDLLGGQDGEGTTTPNSADGDVIDLSVLSFGGILGVGEAGGIVAEDSIDFTFFLANVDAITAIDTSGASPGDPSGPSTELALNAGQEGGGIDDDITAKLDAGGSGSGGVTGTLFAAGFDVFTRIDTGGAAPTGDQVPANSIATAPRTPDFAASFGTGDIDAYVISQDQDPTNGLEVADVELGAFLAGQEITANAGILAQDDIIFRTIGDIGGNATDNVALAPDGLDLDVAAGLMTNAGLSPLALGALFDGADNAGQFLAGDDVGSTDADGLALFTVQGGPAYPTGGDFEDAFRLVSGIEDQLASADLFDNFTGWPTVELETDPESTGDGNISAFLIAGDDVEDNVIIDAGDTQRAFANYGGNMQFAGGLGGGGGLAGGSFRGGIHTGAGVDLDIAATADNDTGGRMDATIRTETDLNVEDMTGITLGILVEDGMTVATIEVGYGVNGGNLLGNIVAEQDIDEIEVWGDIGRAGQDSLIYTGALIDHLGIGDAQAVGASAWNDIQPDELYTGRFVGTLYADIYMGGDDDGGLADEGAAVYVGGGGIAAGANIAVGVDWGVNALDLERAGDRDTYTFNEGEGAFFIQGGDVGADPADAAAPGVGTVEIVATDGDNVEGSAVDQVDLQVDSHGSGTGASIHSLIVGDPLELLHVNDGSVGQITVDDDLDIAAIMAGYLTDLGIAPTDYAFLVNSLPAVSEIEINFNNDKTPIWAGEINVDYNIGIEVADPSLIASGDISIGQGLNATMDNYAIYVQGDLEGPVTSESGSIGNVVVGERISDATPAQAAVFDTDVDDIGVWVWIDTDHDDRGDDLRLVGADNGVWDQIAYLDPSGATITVQEPETGEETGYSTPSFSADFAAHASIGDVYAGRGSVTSANEFFAGGSLGVISAEDHIVSPTIDVAENVGGLIARTGSLSATVYVHGSIGLLQASGNVSGSYTAETGDIGLDLDATDRFAVVNGAGIHSYVGNISAISLTAGNDIGNTEAHVGSIGPAVDYVAGNGIGNLTAGMSIAGAEGTEVTLTAERAAVGDLLTQTGDIGAPGVPVDIDANGGVEIDPYSLEYVHIINGSTLDGVGTVYAEIGNIYVDITTGGSVGAVDSVYPDTTPVLGGIAAPLGEIVAALKVGGHLGGLSAQSVTLEDGWIVLGSIGILRNVEGGSGRVQNVDAINPLIIIADGVDYRVEVVDGTADVSYTVADGAVVFDSIAYTPGAAGGISVLTTTGGRTQAGETEDSPVQTVVTEMVIHGDVADVEVEGDLLSLTVDANLAGGTLRVEGAAGDIDVAGNLGSANVDANPFAADDMAIQIDQFDPSIFSLDVAGTNYGLANVTLNSREWVTWENTLDYNGAGDQYITVYLGSGSAALTVNNGFLESVEIANGRASDLVILTSDTEFDSSSDTVPTTRPDDPVAYATLRAQPRLVARGINASGEVKNEVFEGGSGSDGDNDTAYVGVIVGEGGSRLRLRNLVVEGSVAKIDGSVYKSSVRNVTVAGDLDEVIASSALVGLDIRGSANIVDGGVKLSNVEINGNVGVMSAVRTISRVNVGGNVDVMGSGQSLTRVNVGGNAGSMTAGKSLSNVSVGGSMVALSAQRMKNVQVAGSVGVEVTEAAFAGLDLGAAFSAADVARVFGIFVDFLAGAGDEGPDGGRFLGGVEADRLASVSVGGSIADLTVRGRAARGFGGLLNATVDDAYVRVGRRGNFVKEDGEYTEWPDRLPADEQIIINLDVL